MVFIIRGIPSPILEDELLGLVGLADAGDKRDDRFRHNQPGHCGAARRVYPDDSRKRDPFRGLVRLYIGKASQPTVAGY